MSRQFEEARRMLVRAVAEIKGGEYLTAKRYLERLLFIPSTSSQKADAYYWLSEIADTKAEKVDHLQSALGHDMTHHRARKKLAVLQGRLDEAEIINPDEFELTTAEGTLDRGGKRFECPTCGGHMVFSPDGQSLVCEYCNGQSDEEHDKELEEQAFLIGVSTAKGHQKARATQSFECRACGAVFLLAPEILSITCPHCDSTYAIEQAEVRDLIPPEGIIPMAIDEHQARQALLEWYARRNKKPIRIQLKSLKGVYLPAWTFDLGGQIRWTGIEEHQNNQTVRVQDERVIHYDDIFIPAGKPEPRYFQKLLLEFHANDVEPFSPSYLASWLAESYQVPMADAAVNARAAAYKLAQQKQRGELGLGKLQSLQFYSDGIMVESYKLVLVPVWIGHITVQGKMYEALVNGKSSRVYGPKPPGLMEKALGWLLED